VSTAENHFYVPTDLKSGSLNLLESSAPVQACNGIALPLHTYIIKFKKIRWLSIEIVIREQMHVQCNVKARSCENFGNGKAMSIGYSKYVPVALVMQHAKRMRPITLSPVLCLSLIFFHIIS